jgi:hypothetical protein
VVSLIILDIARFASYREFYPLNSPRSKVLVCRYFTHCLRVTGNLTGLAAEIKTPERRESTGGLGGWPPREEGSNERTHARAKRAQGGSGGLAPQEKKVHMKACPSEASPRGVWGAAPQERRLIPRQLVNRNTSAQRKKSYENVN